MFKVSLKVACVVAVHCLLCFRKIWKEEFISCRTITLMDGNSLALLLFFFCCMLFFGGHTYSHRAMDDSEEKYPIGKL